MGMTLWMTNTNTVRENVNGMCFHCAPRVEGLSFHGTYVRLILRFAWIVCYNITCRGVGQTQGRRLPAARDPSFPSPQHWCEGADCLAIEVNAVSRHTVHFRSLFASW